MLDLNKIIRLQIIVYISILVGCGTDNNFDTAISKKSHSLDQVGDLNDHNEEFIDDILQLFRPPQIVVYSDQPDGTKIRPVYNRMNVWDVTHAPNDKFFPFFDEAILMTATGGRETSEIYSEDEYGNAVYDFTNLDSAINNLLTAGIEPLIVLGNTPEDMSTQPGAQGAFAANVGAPKDWNKYFEFMRVIGEHLVLKWGKQTAEKWNYRLMTEPDSSAWWNEPFGGYQKLYDYTLAGLRTGGLNKIAIDLGNLMSPLVNTSWYSEWGTFILDNTESKTLFEDDFNSGNLDKWDISSGNAQVINGEISLGDDNLWAEMSAGNDNWTNYTFKATMRTEMQGEDSWNVGWLLFNYQDSNNLLLQ